ncbi:MAG: DMT family transporter [Burkholderiaceae bacterium]
MRTPSPAPAADPAADAVRGLWLGLLGVVIFAMTLPMTRLAVGSVDAPQLTPTFVAAARAALAAGCSLVYLAWTRAPWPRRSDLAAMGVCALGTVFGFPLFIGIALREVDAMHGAVVTGVLPLATAVAAALWWRQRPSAGFWTCAAAGCALVLGYAVHAGGGRLVGADAWLLGAVACGAVGYVAGAVLSQRLPAEQVICWVLVLSLPITAPLTLLHWPAHPVSGAAWAGLGYVALFSMWLGFFAWYRALALGGTLRVSQVQLLQPFLGLLFAVPVLGERLDPATLVFALAVIGTVFVGRRMPTRAITPQACA